MMKNKRYGMTETKCIGVQNGVKRIFLKYKIKEGSFTAHCAQVDCFRCFAGSALG